MIIGKKTYGQTIPIVDILEHESTECSVSFHTLEISCLWWTGSSQNVFEETPNEKKYHLHII